MYSVSYTHLDVYKRQKEGGVDINDCEAISRAVDPILDEKDPIPDSYSFEVCSAGLERELKRPSDFAQFLGSAVTVKLYKPVNGLKEQAGTLAAYEDGAVTIRHKDSSSFRFRKRCYLCYREGTAARCQGCYML